MIKKLTQGRVGTQLIRLTLPIILGNFALLTFELMDAYFVAQLGVKELAAIGFVSPVMMVLGSIAMGMGIGTSSLIARIIGGGKSKNISDFTIDSLILALLIIGSLSIFGLVTINPLFSALGASANVLPLISEYVRLRYIGLVFLVVQVINNHVFMALGNSWLPSILLTLAAIINLLLDPLLIFGWGDIPSLGLTGAALATLIAEVVVSVTSSLVFYFSYRGLGNFVLRPLQESWPNWKSILHIAVPAASVNLFVPISLGLITSLVARYGTESVAGFGIAVRVEGFTLIVYRALSASIAPFTGQNWGARQYERLTKGLSLSFLFCLIWGGLLAFLFKVNAFSLIGKLANNPAVIAIAVGYLTIVSLSYGALGINMVSSSTLNALGRPLPAVSIAALRTLLLYLPLAYIGSQIFGLYGVFMALCLSNIVVALGAFLWLRHFFKLTQKLSQENCYE